MGIRREAYKVGCKNHDIDFVYPGFSTILGFDFSFIVKKRVPV